MLRLAARASKWRFSRYAAIGALAAMTYVVIATGLRSIFDIEAWLASTFAYAFCIPFAYFGQKHLAFRSNQSHGFAFPRYCTAQVINMTASSALSEVFSQAQHMPDFVIFALSGAVVIAGNYFLLSRWAFKSK